MKRIQKYGLLFHEIMLLAKSEIVLTNRSKQIRNKDIKKCDRLELDGTFTSVTVVKNRVVLSWP